MKVLFISSGKSGKVGDVVWNQGESLREAGIEIDYYIINPGPFGYISSIPNLRRAFKRGNYNLAHAHYSLSGFTAVLAGCSPLVVSLMGSEAFISKFLRVIIRYFYKFKWDSTIVKTQQMKEMLNITKAQIIPNGVDIKRFIPIPKADARRYIGYPPDKKLILFISVPGRAEKNLELAKRSVTELREYDVELKHICNVPNIEIPYYLNASDAMLLTSKWEGSVNVVKEAMACNCPIVSTDVGDVKWVVGETEGCYITSFKPEDVVEKNKAVIAFGKRTNGRKRIIELGLDSETVAGRIIEIYDKVLKKKRKNNL
jgi:teichuronic acid biosynthesis glycosyltransferase TuaC